MKEEALKDLIGKYYEGLTTPEEEKALREYFVINSPEGFEAEKEIFNYYATKLTVPEPSDDLEERIIDKINTIEGSRGIKRPLRYLVPLLSTAASLLVITGLWFFYQSRNESADTYDDPAIAYAETMKLLYSVSVQLNKGAMALEPVSILSDVTEKGINAISKSSGKIEKNLIVLSKTFKDADIQLKEKNKN